MIVKTAIYTDAGKRRAEVVAGPNKYGQYLLVHYGVLREIYDESKGWVKRLFDQYVYHEQDGTAIASETFDVDEAAKRAKTRH